MKVDVSAGAKVTLGNYCGVKRVAQESCAENYMDIMHRVRIGVVSTLPE